MTAKALLLGAICVLALAGSARAEDASIENRLRDQLRSTVTQLRQLQDSQATLQAQKAAAEQERDALKKKVGSGGGGGGAASAKAVAAAAALKRSLAGARQETDTLKQTEAQSQAEIVSLKQQLDQAQATMRSLQSQDETLKASLASTGATLEACKLKNVALLKAGYEILGRYKKEDLDDVLAAKEPFTGFKRVQLQNLAQGYEDRLYAGRYDPRRDKAPPAPPPADNVTQPSSH